MLKINDKVCGLQETLKIDLAANLQGCLERSRSRTRSPHTRNKAATMTRQTKLEETKGVKRGREEETAEKENGEDVEQEDDGQGYN
jgi:hypothetical protein